MYAINLDENKRVLRATLSGFADSSSILVNALPEGDLYEYLYQDGEFIHSPRVPTQEELDAIAKQEAEKQKAIEQAVFLENSSERVTAVEEAGVDTDEALCSLYEKTLTQQATIDEQDEAICALYELAALKGGES